MTAPSTTSSRRAAPPKRLSLITTSQSFQLSSPPLTSSSSLLNSPPPAKATPRRNSSISYTTTNRTPNYRSYGIENSLQSASEPTISSVVAEPLTLPERHASLLFLIAEKESRCLELRTQLSQQESELAGLKKRWERILIASSPTMNLRQPTSATDRLNASNRHSISEESSTSDSSASVMTPSDENSVPSSESPARIALPGTLGLSMMYKEVQAGIVRSEKLKRASVFLNDMFTSALGSPVPPTYQSQVETSVPATPSDRPKQDVASPSTTKAIRRQSTIDPDATCKLPQSFGTRHRRTATTSLLDDDDDLPHFSQILAPDTRPPVALPQPAREPDMVTTAPAARSGLQTDEDDEEWNW